MLMLTRFFCVSLFLLMNYYLHSTTYYVNDNETNNDIFCSTIGLVGNDGLSVSTPMLTLTDVLNTYGTAGTNVLTSGDVIYIDAGMYFESDANLALDINGLTIIGAGNDLTYFDNNHSGGDFERWAIITGDDIIITDMYITGYTYAAEASALLINGAQNFTLTNVIVNENKPGGGSTAILIKGGSVGTLNGGGASCNPGHLSVAGGGVNVEGAGNDVTINNYTCSRNEKDYQGGSGLCVLGTSTVTVTNSTFSNNINGSAYGGGAIFLSDGATVNISFSCFSANEASQVSSVNYGGAISVGRGGSLNVDNCSFSNNFASPSGYGGAISVKSGFGSSGSTTSANIYNCSFTNNSAANGSDVMGDIDYSQPVTIDIDECTWSGTSEDIDRVSSAVINVSNSGVPSGGYNLVNSNVSTTTPATNCPSVPMPCFSAIPLSVEVKDLKYKCVGDQIELVWNTASEKNNDYFIIESSLDGINWSQEERVESVHNSQITYGYAQLVSNNEQSFIRLAQVDFDGRRENLRTISVSRCFEEEILIDVNQNKEVHVIANSKIEDIHLYNMIGQIVQKLNTRIVNNELIFEGAELPEGIYVIEVKTTKGYYRQKIRLI